MIPSLKRNLARLWNAVMPTRGERELARELDAHLGVLEDEGMARGMTRSEARRQARKAVHGVEATKESHRDTRSFRWIDDLRQDLRYAFRSFVRSPSFTIIAVVTLALGIGANTAIFSVVYGVLIRPLPYPSSDRLVRLLEYVPAEMQMDGQTRVSEEIISNDFITWRGQSRALSHLAAFDDGHAMTWGTANDLTRVSGASVTPSVFPLLGVPPLRGRTFEEADGARVIVVSEQMWRRTLGGADTVLGTSVTLDGNDYQIVGVMPASFGFPSDGTAFWVPLEPMWMTNGVTFYAFIGRLADGVTLDAAEAEAETLLRGTVGYMWQDDPINKPADFEIAPVKDRTVAPVRRALLVLLGGVGFVLLIACSNVANLVLARQASRRGETAMRVALGAGRSRLVRQMVTESLLLALLGCAGGIAIATAALNVLSAFGPADIPRIHEIRVDGAMLFFALAVSIATGVLVGLVPVARMIRHSPIQAIKAGAAPTTSSRAGARRTFVAAEVALATMLLIGGGLLIRSFGLLASVDPGFDAENLLIVQVALPRAGPARASAAVLTDAFQSRVEALPGVRGVAIANQLPMRRRSGTQPRIEGIPGDGTRAEARMVSANYLDVMGIDVIAGRGLSEGDGTGQPAVVLVNRSAARAFGTTNPIGQILQVAGRPSEIVGVVEDTHEWGLDREPVPQVYLDARQSSLRVIRPERAIEWGFFAIRTLVDPARLVPDVRRVLLETVPGATLELNVSSMASIVADTVATRRFYALMMGVFAFLAVALSAVGVYGVMAYAVTERTREIGIRVALGAAKRDILGLVLGQSLPVTVTGLVIGLGGAAVATRVLEGMLFGLTPLDPSTFVGVAVILGVVAIVAALVPARRASRVDPLIALRAE